MRTGENTVWIRATKENPVPTEPGTYFVRIGGDSETEDSRVFYEYPDYTTTGVWCFDAEILEETEGERNGSWSLAFEEEEDVLGWYGPISCPEWEESQSPEWRGSTCPE